VEEKTTAQQVLTTFPPSSSPIPNWHSILRTGLRSGHVPGIFMAQQRSYSVGYMASAVGAAQGGLRVWRNSQLGCDSRMSAMSLIEVADLRDDTTKVTTFFLPLLCVLLFPLLLPFFLTLLSDHGW
jgi:hypothetical protein